MKSDRIKSDRIKSDRINFTLYKKYNGSKGTDPRKSWPDKAMGCYASLCPN
jgi:hypothetical protein